MQPFLYGRGRPLPAMSRKGSISRTAKRAAGPPPHGPAAAALTAALAAAQRRAETAERRLQAVLDALPEGVVLLDAETRYLTWNTRYAEIYHRSADLFARGAPLIDILRVGVAR